MFKKLFTVTFVAVILLSAFLSAQDHSVLRPDGDIIKYKGDLRKMETRSYKNLNIPIQNVTKNVYSKPQNVLGTIDTLRLPGPPWASNQFVFYGQDWMLQWFKAPADLTIKKVGFASGGNDLSSVVEVKLVKVNLTYDQILYAPVARRGYYEATGNGFNNATAFMDNPDKTGSWVSFGTLPEPFGNDIWADAGFGLTITPTVQTNGETYDWVDLSLLGEPTLLRDEIFGIALHHTGPDITSIADGVTFFYNDFGIGGWKFYSNGRLTDTDWGWWTREFSWDFVAEVDLTGDRPAVIENVTILGTTLKTTPRTVTADITDDNPSGSTPGGVTAAVLQWSIDGGTTWNDVAMANTGGSTYSGDIPGQASGTNVTYKVKATDDNSGTSESLPKSYKIFAKTQEVLFIYNTGDYSVNNARRLYIGGNVTPPIYIVDPVANDIWLSSDGTEEATDVMSNYKYVIQVEGSFPDVDFSDAAKAYLDGATAGNERNYFLSSQDYGCFINNCVTTDYAAGTFQNDYLGIATLGPQDLAGDVAEIVGVSGDPLSGWVSTYSTDSTVTYWYNPVYELGFVSYIDAITPTTGATAIFTTGGQVTGVRNEGANWKTAFLAYDYAATDFRSDTSLAPGSDPKYAWGIQVGNQALAFLKWAGFTTGVETVNPNVPDKFNLAQNYPNPFNPTTNIRFDIQKTSQVELKVYDVLGKEVQTLVNSQLSPGTYNVNFDAATLATGVYFYTIKAGDFVSSKKMMLIK